MHNHILGKLNVSYKIMSYSVMSQQQGIATAEK